jgi:mannose-6-phosphate isomerase-like protein (cupin superfamily)
LQAKTAETVALNTDITAFKADRAWGARNLADVAGATVRLLWTDKDYICHTNDCAEVFKVVDSAVDMRYRLDGVEHVVRLGANDIFVASVGDEHVAHPVGAAWILVVEEKGSA